MATTRNPKNALHDYAQTPPGGGAGPGHSANHGPGKGIGSLRVFVGDGRNPALSALVELSSGSGDDRCVWNNGGVLERGYALFDGLPPDKYSLRSPYPKPDGGMLAEDYPVQVEAGCRAEVCLDLGLAARTIVNVIDPGCDPRPCSQPVVGDMIEISVQLGATAPDAAAGPRETSGTAGLWPSYVHATFPVGMTPTSVNGARSPASAAGVVGGNVGLAVAANRSGAPDATFEVPYGYQVADRQALPIGGSLTVSHKRRIAEPTGPMAFFVHMLDASKSIGFTEYQAFIDRVLCHGDRPGATAATCQDRLIGSNSKLNRLQQELTDHGVGAYDLLRTATEAFLLLRCCIRPCGPEGEPQAQGWPLGPYSSNLDLGDYQGQSSETWQALFCSYLGNQRLPYIERVINTAFPAYQVTPTDQDARFCNEALLRSRVDSPCFMELIWNYWHEEGMLVQSINAVSRRFQNLRSPGQRDPLAHMEIDPLRPLNNILWGYVENERDRLSIKRRAYEYQHQYGVSLYGKAVADLRPADNRSKFIEAFHNLLNKCADYYRAKQDTTVDPDGYPILHAIQELNLILAKGAHNQFGDLAWNARVDMLMQEWIMSRPELRDFLQSRAMVPYKEAWMPQVDTMKTLQGWTDVVVTHFRDLGVFGEQILLTIRWYNWYDVTSEEEAKAWADLLRAQIQTYIHAYRAVTGVDLGHMDTVDFAMPSLHLRRRLAMQQRAG